MDTVTLTIDGRQVTVEKGKTVLQASIEAGIPLPYYCYHPGISVDGSCRVCIVKIEKMPKLQTSCSMACTEGMVVLTRDPEVVAARAGVFEFLLINHPLDCPVCDKGGECPLQDFSYTFGPAESRMDFPRRVFDGEGVKGDVDFGPTLMLNRQRCILCTRCVRFMKEVDGDAQINIIDRGYGSEIATFREEGVHSLISGNLMDVCPVGAITTRDYRFKSRPWDNPNAADTICTLCSKGCNTTAWIKAKPEWAKGSRLIRVTPRFNPEVNSYWMCDIGRFDYHWIEGEERVRRPLERAAHGSEVNAQQPVTWTEMLSKLRDKPQPPHTKFKVPPIDAPNVNGARIFGLIGGAVGAPVGESDLAVLRHGVEAGRVTALYVLDPGPEGSLGDVNWIIDARRRGTLPLLIVQGVLMTELARAADFVLPGASYVEKEASYTNDQGRLQGTARAIAPPGEAMEDWQILVNVGVALGVRFDYTSSAHVRADIAAEFPNARGLEGLTTLAFS